MLNKGIKRLLTPFVLSLSFTTTAFAAPWAFEIAPYFWGINMNGTVGVGPAKVRVDESFSDLLKHLDMAGMVYATAHKDNFGLYFNGIYTSLSDSGDAGAISANAKNKFGIIGAGISYIAFMRELSNEKKVALEPYFGLRYTFNNTTLDIDSFKFKENENWTDPVLGVRFNYDFNKRWGVRLSGDIGGTNASTHYSYSADAFLKYQADSWQHVKTYVGYRFLKQHYQTGNGLGFYEWNMKLFGPVLGVGFTF